MQITASTGVLSQQLTNLNNLNSQLAALVNLPASAGSIRQEATSLITQNVTTIHAIQAAVLGYTTPTIPALNTALSQISANPGPTTVATVKLAIEAASNGASSLAATVATDVTDLQNSKARILTLSGQLTSLDQSLKSQIAVLQGQAQDAQNQVDYYTKRKWYFLALGPFGLVGLGIAIGMITSWTNKANDLSSQVNSANAQAAAMQQLVNSVEALISAFSNMVNQLSNLKNTVDFLAADISNIVSDLDNSATQNAILFLTAAVQEVQTLATDAS